MKPKLRILVFAGFGGFTQRLDNAFYLLSKELDLEIDFLVFGKSNYRYLIDKAKVNYKDIYCIDEFLDQYKSDIQKDSFIDKIDKNLCRTKHNKMAYVGRNIVQHTHFTHYARDVDHDKIKYYISLMYNKLKPIVSVVDRAFCYTCASIESEIIYDVCNELNIPFMTLNEQRIGYRWSINDNNMDIHNAALKEYREIQKEPSQEGISYLEETLNRVESGNKNIIEKKFQGKRIESKKINIKNLFNFGKNFFLLKEAVPFAPTRSQRLRANFNFKIREFFTQRYLSYKIPKEPYVYFPMPMIPEATTLVRNPDNYDILGLVKRISLQIPLDFKLVVREHPSMIGTTPISFYNEIKKIYNVVLLSPFASNYECIKHSKLIITNTGTAGLESLLLLKKTIVLGSTMYADLNTVFSTSDLSKIDKILEMDEEIQKKAQKNDLLSYYSCLHRNSFEDKSRVFWSRDAFNPEILETDIELCNHLKSKF